MISTRRRFLRTGLVGLTAALSGCTTTLGGKPRPDVPARLVRLGVLHGRHHGYEDDETGTVTGQAVEIAKAVLDLMGVSEVDVELVGPLEELVDGVAAGRFDIVGGLIVRPEWCGRVEFSVPDHVQPLALLVPQHNPMGLRGFDDVIAAAAEMAVTPGGIGIKERALDAGVPEHLLVEFTDTQAMVEAVASGQVDCGAYVGIGEGTFAQAKDGVVDLTAGFVPDGQQPFVIAFGFAKGSELLDGFNSRLRRLRADGDWLKISTPFGFTQDALPDSEVTTAEACER